MRHLIYVNYHYLVAISIFERIFFILFLLFLLTNIYLTTTHVSFKNSELISPMLQNTSHTYTCFEYFSFRQFFFFWNPSANTWTIKIKTWFVCKNNITPTSLLYISFKRLILDILVRFIFALVIDFSMKSLAIKDFGQLLRFY